MKSVTNGEIAALLQGHMKLMDERHGDNKKLLEAILSEQKTTNGRVTRLEERVDNLRSADSKPPRTVMKITGGTGLGVLLTKLLEWVQK